MRCEESQEEWSGGESLSWEGTARDRQESAEFTDSGSGSKNKTGEKTQN